MSPLRLLWRWYDRLYLRFHRAQDLPIPGGAVFWLSLPRYRGPRRVLSDGTVIRPGERIGVLHLHNDAVAALHSPDGSPYRGVMALLERFRMTMQMVAREMVAGALADVRAFSATTVLFTAMARAGFDTLPLNPRWWGRVVGTYQRWVMGHHHPLGNRRHKLDRFVESRAVWISRENLLRRYGPASRSFERETRA